MNNSIFSNLNKPIYIASKKSIKYDDYNNEIIEYNEPFFYKNCNYQFLQGNDLYSYMSVYGETRNKLVRVFIDSFDKDIIKEFDVAYLFGIDPTNEKVNGAKANYKVRTVAEQNTKIMVVFEEIIKEEN